jgi:hypothetical protein
MTQPRAHIKGSSEDPTQNPEGRHFRKCGRSRPLQACAKGASPQLKWHPQEREHSDGKAGTRDRVQRRDRLTAAPADGAVIAIAEGGPLPRVPPARCSETLARGIKAARPRRRGSRFTRARCGASRTRPNKIYEDASLRDPDFLPSVGLRVIDSDLNRRKTPLELFSTCPRAVAGRKFGLQSAIHFKRVTRSR